MSKNITAALLTSLCMSLAIACSTAAVPVAPAFAADAQTVSTAEVGKKVATSSTKSYGCSIEYKG